MVLLLRIPFFQLPLTCCQNEEISSVAFLLTCFSSRCASRGHGWRKLVPRPRHPKANPEAQAAFKKTLSKRFKQHWPHAILTTSEQC